MLQLTLPQSRTYLPGPRQCIYCRGQFPIHELSREHIIPRKLGGALVLHKASCPDCARIINKEVETPTLTYMWVATRTRLGMPTSRPRGTVEVGKWKTRSDGKMPHLEDDKVRWEQAPLAVVPFQVVMPMFAPPGILEGREPTDTFSMVGVSTYVRPGEPVSPPASPGESAAEFVPFRPEILCRALAKIAHGAAVAELGLEGFEPLLPEVILGKSTYISHVVGSVPMTSPRRRRDVDHEITLAVRGGFLVARVHLFARFASPYVVVVGRPSQEIAKWHLHAVIPYPT